MDTTSQSAATTHHQSHMEFSETTTEQLPNQHHNGVQSNKQEVDNTTTRIQRAVSLEEAPDGGWGWVMVIGAGMALSVITGFNKSAALLYQQLLTRFGQSAAATATATSIAGTTRMMASPLGSILINHTSHKTVGILAGLVCATGIILTGFMPALLGVYISYGIIQGIGVSMFIVSDQSMVNLYFSANRGKANALRGSFLGVGALYMTQLLSYLFDTFGFTGALLITGALMLNLIPASHLFRPLKKEKKQSRDFMPAEEVSDNDIQDVEMEVIIKDSDCSLADAHKTVRFEERSQNSALIHTEDRWENCPINDNKEESKPCVRQKLLKGVGLVAAQFGLSAFKNPLFCMCVVLMSSFSILNTLNISLIAGMALEKGYTMEQVTTGMTLNFATEIVTRLLSGILFDLPCVRPRRLLVFAMFATAFGSLAILQPYTPIVIPSMALWMAMNGLMGAFQAQSGTVMSDTVPRSTITSSVGLMRFIQGIGNLTGPVIGGLLKDVTGSYSYGYVFAGTQMCMVSAICIVITLSRSKKS